MLIVSPPIVVVHMVSYYAGIMTHATHIWVIMRIGVFIGCRYGFETRIDLSREGNLQTG